MTSSRAGDRVGIDDSRIDELTNLIRNSFRVRPNHDPIYVDMGGNLQRFSASQHQIVFGRRGSGKSCLMVHYYRNANEDYDTLALFVDADEVKKLQYPDLLIRLLLSIFEQLPSARRRWWQVVLRQSNVVQDQVKALRLLLDTAVSQDVTQNTETRRRRNLVASGDAQAGSIGAEISTETSSGHEAVFRAEKLDAIERHLQDYKSALRWGLERTGSKQATLLIDDFYLLSPSIQPDVVDYLHRLVRGTDIYLKIGTVRHRTELLRADNGQAIGVELYQDVEEINLDRTFEDLVSTQAYLAQMLGAMAAQVGIDDLYDGSYFNPDALRELTLASGGVPRDFLTIFVEAVGAAREQDRRWLTPTHIRKAAGRNNYRTKIKNLQIDTGPDSGALERVFQDLTSFCLREKKKTAFLISQEDAQRLPSAHEYVMQLMDFKLIHIIEPDTSAASGRGGRYEAYTLDWAIFMEPRLRTINHVEFWRTDDESRRVGVREAPVYPLDRVALAVAADTQLSSEALLDAIGSEVGIENGV